MIYYVSARNNVPENTSRATIEEALSILLRYNLLYEDTETKTLDYLEENPVKLLQLGTGEDEFIFDVHYVDLSILKPILENPKIIKVCVNKFFERNMLKSLNIDFRGSFDLSIAYSCYRMGRELRRVEVAGNSYYIYSLTGMYKELLDITIDKEQQLSFLTKSEVYTKEQLEYVARDVRLMDLYENIYNKCVKEGILHINYNLHEDVKTQIDKGSFLFVTLEQMVADIFADMSYRGIRLDKEAWMTLHNFNLNKKVEVERKLNELAKEKYPSRVLRTEPIKDNKSNQYDIWGNITETISKKTDKHRINWNSPIQVKDLLNKMIGYVPKDKQGRETTSSKELLKIKFKEPSNEFVNYLINQSELAKRISSFGRNYLEVNVNKVTDKIHTSFNTILETGRVASIKPNLMQIPKAKEYRACFIPDLGYDMVACDYSAQESRIMAYLAKDSVFMDFFENGDGDSHSMIATKVFTSKYGIDIKVSKKELKIENKLIPGHDSIKLGKSLFPEADVITENKDFVIFKSSKGLENPLRQTGKILNFFISFGGSAYTLSKEQEIPIEDANSLISGFWQSFKGLNTYFNEEKRKALANGYIVAETVTNTIRQLPAHRDLKIANNKLEKAKKDLIVKYGENKAKTIYYSQMKTPGSEFKYYSSNIMKIKGDIERAAMNTRIQTTASRMTKIALLLIEEENKENDLGIQLLLPVHDEIVAQIRENTTHENVIKSSMEKASSLLLGTLIPALPEKGKKWIH